LLSLSPRSLDNKKLLKVCCTDMDTNYKVAHNNICFCSCLVICTMTSVILVAARINYDADFNQLDIPFFQGWILEDSSLTTTGKSFLKTLFETIKTTDALRTNCSKGQPFLFLWVTLILLFVAFLISLYSYFVLYKTWNYTPPAPKSYEDREASSSSKHKGKSKRRDSADSHEGGHHGFGFGMVNFPSCPSLTSLPSMPSFPSLPSLPSLPSIDIGFDGDFGGGGDGGGGDD